MQPKMENFTVTCLKCKKSSHIRIVNGEHIHYIDQVPIISCRLRGDMNWGFECECGNDSRLAREEKEDARILVQGGKHSLEKLIDSLKVKDEKKFKMVGA